MKTLNLTPCRSADYSLHFTKITPLYYSTAHYRIRYLTFLEKLVILCKVILRIGYL